MTWRWILSFSRRHKTENYIWPIWMQHRTNGGLQWTLRIPFVGLLMFIQQQPMWFSDMWRRQRDRDDADKRERPVRAPAIMGRSPFKPTVIDGGRSIH